MTVDGISPLSPSVSDPAGNRMAAAVGTSSWRRRLRLIGYYRPPRVGGCNRGREHAMRSIQLVVFYSKECRGLSNGVVCVSGYRCTGVVSPIILFERTRLLHTTRTISYRSYGTSTSLVVNRRTEQLSELGPTSEMMRTWATERGLDQHDGACGLGYLGGLDVRSTRKPPPN